MAFEKPLLPCRPAFTKLFDGCFRIATRQWFVRLLDKKDALLEMGDRIHWHPDFMRIRYRMWTENLSFDWAISRQRYFGVSFPLWYPICADGEIDRSRPIIATVERLPIDPLE